jgi:hypothetical protein
VHALSTCAQPERILGFFLVLVCTWRAHLVARGACTWLGLTITAKHAGITQGGRERRRNPGLDEPETHARLRMKMRNNMMQEAKRRLAAAGFFGVPASISTSFADSVMNRASGTPSIVVVSPVFSDGEPSCCYFIACTADAEGVFDMALAKFTDVNRELAEQCRIALLMALDRRRPLLAIHDFDDGVEMLRFCEASWPCYKSRGLRAAFEGYFCPLLAHADQGSAVGGHQ